MFASALTRREARGGAAEHHLKILNQGSSTREFGGQKHAYRHHAIDRFPHRLEHTDFCASATDQQLQAVQRPKARLHVGLFRKDLPDRVRPVHKKLPTQITSGMIQVVLLSVFAMASTAMAAAGAARAQSNDAILRIEAKIPLGEVRGRIDHMAIDFTRRRLFVAELGNNTAAIVDVGQGKVLQVLSGQRQPQGVGHLPSTDTLYVANGGDGSVRLFEGPEYTANGRVDLGNDADNVRVDQPNQRVVVGYGDGALAVIDGAKRTKISETKLPAHPEGFQLDASMGRAYVNIPSARGIAVVDLSSSKVIAVWPIGGASANFPLAVDNDSNHVLAVFRNPPKLGVFDKGSGSIVRMVDVCGDADDLFVDAKRHRVYVSCGAGMIDIFDARSYERLSRIPTASGARTSLFVPELDRLFLAVRAGVGSPAAIWVLRPEP